MKKETIKKTTAQGTIQTITFFHFDSEEEAVEDRKTARDVDVEFLVNVPLRVAKAWFTKQFKKPGWPETMDWEVRHWAYMDESKCDVLVVK